MTRVVLLGASNVTLGFGLISRLLRAGLDGPLDLRAAIGHGRSYGAWSSVLVRALPPIIDCGLWRGLAAAPPAPTYALLTDVGNDLLYGFPPDRIAGWVETCLDRLAAAEARTVVVRLPVARVERLSAARYHAVRVTFFPRHRSVSWPEMLGRVRELDERVAAAARDRGAVVVTPPRDWYGFDPIHIRRGRRPVAWSQVLAAWPGFAGPTAERPAGLSLLGRMPERYRLCGRERTARQPVLVRDGLSLSLY